MSGAARRKRKMEAFALCPECKAVLVIAGVSNAYVTCTNKHVFARSAECYVRACRRRASSFTWSAARGHRAYCKDHDSWPC